MIKNSFILSHPVEWKKKVISSIISLDILKHAALSSSEMTEQRFICGISVVCKGLLSIDTVINRGGGLGGHECAMDFYGCNQIMKDKILKS